MSAKKIDPKYTIVQHSGYGYNGDTTFERGVESRRVTTVAEKKLVLAVDGVLFDTYTEAEDFTEKAMYPPGNDGMVPTVLGSFSAMKIDGLAIYIPVRTVVG